MICVTLKQVATLGSNRLLNCLPENNRTQFIDCCDVVNLKLNEVIGNPGDRISYIYFPIKGIISWEKKIADSPFLVVSLIGNEGMLCISLILDVDITPCRAVVQSAGYALRISAVNFIHQMEHNPTLSALLKRYEFVTYSQLLQTTACNLYHVLEKRLARLLLMFQDKSQSNELHITQELLAQMLGVRRVGVTKAAGSLQQKNLISYSRGDLTIHDSAGLKATSCSCFQADKDIYEQIIIAKNNTLLIEPGIDEIVI